MRAADLTATAQNIANNYKTHYMLGAFGQTITAVANIGSRAGYNSRRWTKHGRLPWIDYTGQTSAGPLRIGDRVRLEAGATIYGSKSKFAPWVYNAVLYLREIKGDRAVISTQQSGAVTGATQLGRLKRA